MNKLIFQIGLLAFCISVVIIGLEDTPVLETVARSFIVFVGVVIVGVLALVVTSLAVKTSRQAQGISPSGEEESALPPAQPKNGKRQQSAMKKGKS